MIKPSFYFRLFFWLIIIALVAGAGVIVWQSVRPKREVTVTVAPAVVRDVREMARLCTVEIYSELPVQDTVDNKVIVAVQKLRGYISFDVDNLRVDDSSDTVRAVLPPEIIEIFESTDDDAFRVIDTKGLGLLSSDRLTNSQDNRFKNKLRLRAERRLYEEGVVANARKEARQQLAHLLSRAYQRPVVVRDSMPRGKIYRPRTAR